MTDHEEKYLEFVAAYVLGALDGEDLTDFETHLKSGCAICAAEIAASTEIAALIPRALPQTSPPHALKERVMQAVRLSAQASAQVDARSQRYLDRAMPPPARRSLLMWGLAIGVTIMIVVFSLSYNSLLNTLNEKNQAIFTQQSTITALNDELQRKTEILKVLQSRRIDIVTMDGQQVNPIGYGKIIWDPEKRIAILQVSHLPKVPKDKDYQLWVIKKSEPTKPVSAGVFAVENETETENYFKVQPLEIVDRSEIGAFAITLEPKGGLPAPTGAMYLVGKTSAN